MVPLYDEPLILTSDNEHHPMDPVDDVSFHGLKLRVVFVIHYLTFENYMIISTSACRKFKYETFSMFTLSRVQDMKLQSYQCISPMSQTWWKVPFTGIVCAMKSISGDMFKITIYSSRWSEGCYICTS